MTEDSMKLQVRLFVRDACNVISNVQHASELRETLQRMTALLPRHKYVEGLPFEESKLLDAQREFMKSHYVMFVEHLCKQWSVDWFSHLPKGSVAILVDIFFLEGNLCDALLVLGDQISGNSSGYKLNYAVLLMERLLEGHKLQEMFWCQCNVVPSHDEGSASRGRVHTVTQQLWDDVIALLSTLPDRITARMQNQTSDMFYPNKYVPFLAREVLSVLQKVHAQLQSKCDCSVQFLSQLLAKLSFVGHGELLWSELFPCLSKLVMDDFIWARICEKIIIGGPERSLENVVMPIIKLAPGYQVLSRVLGNAVVTSVKLQYILTNKVILLRYFEQDIILQNIIGYLATSSSRDHLFLKLLRKVLNVWGDASALKHTSYEQHQYITRAILICLAFMTDRHKTVLKEDLVQLLMLGMQCHLDSPLPQVRRLGMIVGESLTAALDLHGHKLQFEYEDDEEVQRLKALLTPPLEIDTKELQSSLKQLDLTCDVGDDSSRTTKADSKNLVGYQNTKKVESVCLDRDAKEPESDLDSDDDLEPYDMSNDVKVTKVKPPVYLRDCMEGLISSDDPERVEACLLVAENLIRKHPSSTAEVAAEFAKLLLHLQDNAALSCLMRCRHAALVALAVTAPVQVSDYLTHEFYQRNYSVKQRMDILQTLGAAAQELSQPDTQSDSHLTHEAKRPKITPVEPTTEIPGEDWREIVQRRIESKTRRFAHGQKQPPPSATANRFSPVAGHFFFPLMKNFDKQQTCLDLLGEDHLLLGRLVYTLGVVIHAAVNTPVVRQMASALLEFIWALRYHPQAGVRRALLFTISMTVLSVPGHLMLTDYQDIMTEAKGWLEDVFEKDADSECKKLAIQALVLLDKSIKQEFQDCTDL